jgi:adenylate cyclase
MTSLLKRIGRLKHAFIFVSVTFIGLVGYSIGIPFLDLMELKTIDLRFQSRDKIQPGSEIVLAVVDEKSIAQEGKWIWPRSKFAELITRLSEAGVRIIAFDIGFLEPDNKRAVEIIESIQQEIKARGRQDQSFNQYLEKLKIDSDDDQRLAEAIKNSKARIVLGYFFQMNSANAPTLSKEELKQHRENIRHSKYNLELYTSEAARGIPLNEPIYPQSNIAQLADAAKYSGYFNMLPDKDGVVRWLPAVLKSQEILYAPLSLVTVSAFLESQLSVTIDDYGVRSIQIGPVVVPTDEEGRILINYRGKEKTFPHIPVTDILQKNISSDAVKNKIVIVGATAVGIYDLRVTPFGEIFPGLEIHANVVDSILSEDFLQRPKWVAIFDIFAILIAGLFMGIVLPRLSVIPGLATGLALFLSYILFCQFLFTSQGLVLNIIYPLSVLLLVYVNITAYRYFVETKQKRFIKNAFATYLAPSVVKQLIESPEHLELGGEEREITAFFSDVQGFTSISESLTPAEIVELLNEFLTEITEIILQNEGTVDKFEGDAIIAFFGAPNVLPDHAARSCLACIEMQKRLVELRHKWNEAGKPALRMRIGLCTGMAVVGNMGSENRMDYTMMGDTVNTASRLEGVNKHYGIYTLISETTYRAAGNDFAVREIDAIKVVGKKAPVTVYELLGSAGEIEEPMQNVIGYYGQGLQAYRSRNWRQAAAWFQKALQIDPDDGPSRTMLKRLQRFKQAPPDENWDGSYDIRIKY